MRQLQATRPIPRLTVRDALAVILLRHPLELLTHLAKTYGDVIRARIAWENVVFLNHPDDIRELLVVQHENFRKGEGVMLLDRMLGKGLITNDGPSHKKQRRLVQPAFHRKRIAGYATAMVEAAWQQAHAWQDGAKVDMAEEMLHLTLVIVGRTLFNTDVTAEADTFYEALDTAMEAFRKIGLSSGGRLIERLPFPINARLRRARARLDQVAYRVIDEHRRTGVDQGDLLSMLLLARDEDGKPMDELQLRDEIMTLFLAGHETVAHALTWTFYLLTQHPDVLARLQQEVDAVLGDRPATFEDLPKLVYTERVLTESMRVCPPVWAIDRRAIRDVNLRGIPIPQGSRVIMSQYVVHHDARFYPHPERFDPERWTPEAREARPKFAYFPFGGGPRLCVGEPFAWTEGILLLATISQFWEARLAPDARIEFQPAVTLRPRYGVKMTLHRRAARAGQYSTASARSTITSSTTGPLPAKD
jgi:cytochrome P450